MSLNSTSVIFIFHRSLVDLWEPDRARSFWVRFVGFVGVPVAEKIPSRRVVVYPQKAPSGMTARGLLAWERSTVDLTTVSPSSASPSTHTKPLDFVHATLTSSPRYRSKTHVLRSISSLVAVWNVRRIGEVVPHHRLRVCRVVGAIPASRLANVWTVHRGPEGDHVLVDGAAEEGVAACE